MTDITTLGEAKTRLKTLGKEIRHIDVEIKMLKNERKRKRKEETTLKRLVTELTRNNG